MPEYRPRSGRGRYDPRLDELHEGFPSWLHEPVLAWLDLFLTRRMRTGGSETNSTFLRNIQVRLRLDPPLDWTTYSSARHNLVNRIVADANLALDVLDYAVFHVADQAQRIESQVAIVQKLNEILRDGGSAWEATPTDDESHWALTRRDHGPAREAIATIASTSERAGSHLLSAWSQVAGREVDASGGNDGLIWPHCDGLNWPHLVR